MSFNSKN